MLENGKLYIGVTNLNYIGRYDELTDSLLNCQMMVPQQGGQLGMSYPNYPHLLKLKFAARFMEVNISCEKFVYFIDVSELELGPELEKTYVQITTGLDLAMNDKPTKDGSNLVGM